MDSALNPPFSFSIGLNKDHPLVQEVIQKEAKGQVKAGGELIEKLIESSPSLKRKMEEFEIGLQPPPQEKIE